ncbi:hypothetical protein KBC75_01250 [Candidatus Shapirobacteria bacterium]|nr:hypothetical protein [Candidatus Shapirobacteria bacterium]
MVFTRQKEYLISDIKRQGQVELALVYRENGRGKKEHERISPYKLKFDKNGEPNFDYGRDTFLKQAEADGMRSVWELAQEKKCVIWASPPGGPENYPEGRLVVGWVIKKGDETEIDCRGIPILENGENIKKMVDDLLNRGGVVMDEIMNVEDLRREAVGVDCESWEQFINLCEDVFGNHKVWEKIKRGEDVAETRETERVVVNVMKELEVRGYSNNPLFFEMVMLRQGYSLMGNNHGDTNISSSVGLISPFNRLFSLSSAVSSESLDPRLQYCEVHKVHFLKKRGRCPKCKG